MKTNKIKVLHIADKLSLGNSTIHGVTRLFSMWIPRFDRDKFDVSVCSFRAKDKAGEYLESHNIKVYYLNKGKFDPTTLSGLLKIVKDHQFDILHLHGYGAWTFGRIAGLITKTPIVVHEHMVDPNIPLYQRFADQLLSGTTTHAIAISESVKDFMVDYRRIAKNQVSVVINGIPLESFTNGNTKVETIDKWRSELNIPHDHKVIGTVGRLHVIKGHRYFLDAAAEVLKVYPKATFLIVGDGELRETLTEQARQLNIEQNVRFTGHCHDIAPLYSLMDIVIIASLSEGGPLTLFEAMATKCAVIATNSIGLKDVIIEGETGFLVPPKDASAIADRLLRLLRDDVLLETMKNTAFREVKKYDIEATVRYLEGHYRQVLQEA